MVGVNCQALSNWSQSLHYCLWKVVVVAAEEKENELVSVVDVMQLEVEEWVLASLWQHDQRAEGHYAATAAAGHHKGQLAIIKRKNSKKIIYTLTVDNLSKEL